MTDMQELLGLVNGEPPVLNEVLAPYVREVENGMSVLSHPLVQMIPYFPNLAGLVNRNYELKLAVLDRYHEEGNWHGYVWAHERPYRCEAFESIADELDDDEYWELLRAAWTDSENIHEGLSRWRRLLTSDRPGRADGLMTAEERRALRAMPDVIKVWRGVRRVPDEGLSWTTDRDKAVWFAERTIYPGRRIVLRGTVAKHDVIAYFSARGESEIVSDAVDSEVTS